MSQGKEKAPGRITGKRDKLRGEGPQGCLHLALFHMAFLHLQPITELGGTSCGTRLEWHFQILLQPLYLHPEGDLETIYAF